MSVSVRTLRGSEPHRLSAQNALAFLGGSRRAPSPLRRSPLRTPPPPSSRQTTPTACLSEFGWPRWKRRSRTSGRASRRRSTTRRSWARTCCSCAWPLGLRRSGLYRHGTGRHEWHDVAVGLAAMGLAPQSSKTPICPACASLPCPHLRGCASLSGVGFSMRGFSMRTAQCTQLFASGRRCMCRAAKYSCTNCLSSMCAWIWTGNG